MTDEASNPEPERMPGERRLARPPSERYRAPEAPEPAPPMGSRSRALLVGGSAAIAGSLILTVLGGLAFSAGLVAVAGVLGWAIAFGVRAGAGMSLRGSTRVMTAVLFALLSVLAGQLGIWLFALSEGGVLGPLDYLAETFGVLVPVQVAAAAVVAWFSAR